MPSMHAAGLPPHGQTPGPGPAGGGDVLPFTPRKGAARTPFRTDVTDISADAAPAEPEVQLAVTIETLHMARGRTLSDPATAEGYDIAMEAVALMLDGAEANGILPTAQHKALRSMLAGMQCAPEYL